MYNKKLMEREIAQAIFGYNMYTVLLQLLCAVDNNTCFLVTQSVAFFSERKGKKTQVSAITINLRLVVIHEWQYILSPAGRPTAQNRVVYSDSDKCCK